jgi:transposase-like protein
MLTCPHCGEQTTYPYAAEFEWVDAGRFICAHCQKEFFALHNLPMTKEQFDAQIKARRTSWAHARAG